MVIIGYSPIIFIHTPPESRAEQRLRPIPWWPCLAAMGHRREAPDYVDVDGLPANPLHAAVAKGMAHSPKLKLGKSSTPEYARIQEA